MKNRVFDVFVHNQDNAYYLMVRNSNTSYAMGSYTLKQYQQCVRLRDTYLKYSAAQLLSLYRIAKEKNLLCMRHEYTFADQRNAYVRPLTADELRLHNAKGHAWKRGYCVCVRIPREVIVIKKPYRKDCEATLRTWRLEYTPEELVEKVKEKLVNGRQRHAVQ